MILQFDKAITEKHPELFDYVESKSLWYPIYYLIDHRVRVAANLQEWIKKQLDNPSEELELIAATFDKTRYTDYLMTDILRWVQKNITYVTDDKVYKTPEKWQTPSETLALKTGDCEDGAILMYALAHMCGVPDNRLLLFAGFVTGGGHCWLGYRSDEYPLNWCFMDWCYWFDRSTPNARQKYYIQDTTIYDDPLKRYHSIWFAFNSSNSFKGIMNKNEY